MNEEDLLGDTSPVFDRQILIGALDEHNQRVYRTVREITGLDPENPSPWRAEDAES